MNPFLKNYSLKDLNTMKIDVNARFYVEVKSVEQLCNLLKSDIAEPPFYVLGGGSNVLFLRDFEGTILHINIKGKKVLKEDEDSVFIKVSAGENWHEFVLYALRNNYGGIENLSLIPGKVGASPMQNIGAYGVELKDVFESLEALEISSQKIKTFSRQECNFGYRDSVFKNVLKNKYIITSVTFRLSKRNHTLKTEYGAIRSRLDEMGITHPNIQQISQAVIDIRNSKLPNPAEIPNAGSFFKNPTISKDFFSVLKDKYPDIKGYPIEDGKIKVPAAWLIEKSGWKAYKNDSVGVHEKQALVLINHHEANGLDVYNLSQEILEDVHRKFGIQLEREVNIIH